MKIFNLFTSTQYCPLCRFALSVNLNKKHELIIENNKVIFKYDISSFNNNYISGNYGYNVELNDEDKFNIEVYKNDIRLDLIPVSIIYRIISQRHKNNTVHLNCQQCANYHLHYSNLSLNFKNLSISTESLTREFINLKIDFDNGFLKKDSVIKIYNNYQNNKTTIYTEDYSNLSIDGLEIPLIPFSGDKDKYLKKISKLFTFR